MTLEDHRWVSGSHEPSEIIYKIVCVAVHFVEGEKSVYIPNRLGTQTQSNSPILQIKRLRPRW